VRLCCVFWSEINCLIYQIWSPSRISIYKKNGRGPDGPVPADMTAAPVYSAGLRVVTRRHRDRDLESGQVARAQGSTSSWRLARPGPARAGENAGYLRPPNCLSKAQAQVKAPWPHAGCQCGSVPVSESLSGPGNEMRSVCHGLSGFAVSHSPPLASRPFRLLKSVSLHHPSQSPLRLGVSLRDSVRHPGEPESRSLPVAGWVQAPSPGRRPSGSQARTRCNQELLLPADAGPHNSKQLEPPTVLRLA
jgi:hypothetical protein